ncbi:MAG: DNA-protecting protein DprA, partial [Ruminiclostridium sp.]|nr:DNA-protecting protein DprA [Ruminiclostridium sp.]
MTEYYLWLLQLMGAANPKSLQLIQHYGSAKNVYEAVVIGKERKFLSPFEEKRLGTATLENAQRIMEECKKAEIKIVTLNDEDYPYRLQNIYNPPILLFYKGSLSGINSEVCITGVGARGATAYTAKVTRHTCMDLAKLGTVLVSGMAAGVDHLVHQSAIDVGGKTVGVLACGIGIDYPRGSIPTRERMYELGGACISELLPYTQTSKGYFHARNRIMSGLSLGTIVFQAGKRSGSLITADHAIQQGRDLFCVPPHDLFDPDYSGVVKYLRDGAIPLFNYLDVVNCYFSAYTDKLNAINEKYTVSPENHFAFVKKESKPAKEKSRPKTALKSEKTRSQLAEESERAMERSDKFRLNEKTKTESFDFESKEPEYKAIYDFLAENGQQGIEAITNACG